MPNTRDVGLDVAVDLGVLVRHPNGDDLVHAILLLAHDLTLALIGVQDLNPFDGETLVFALVERRDIRRPIDQASKQNQGDAAIRERSTTVARSPGFTIGIVLETRRGIGFGENEELSEFLLAIEVGLGDETRDVVGTKRGGGRVERGDKRGRGSSGGGGGGGKRRRSENRRGTRGKRSENASCVWSNHNEKEE